METGGEGVGGGGVLWQRRLFQVADTSGLLEEAGAKSVKTEPLLCSQLGSQIMVENDPKINLKL
jgi:hypothetical protein